MSSRENELHDEMVREIDGYLAMRRRPHSTPGAGSSSPETTSREAPPYQPHHRGEGDSSPETTTREAPPHRLHHRGEGYYQWVVLLALAIAMVFLGYPGSPFDTTLSKTWASNTTLVEAAQHYHDTLNIINSHVNRVANLQTTLELINNATMTMDFNSDYALVHTHKVNDMHKHISTHNLVLTRKFLEFSNTTMFVLADSNLSNTTMFTLTDSSISVGEMMATVAPLEILALDAHVEIYKLLRSVQYMISMTQRQSLTPSLEILEFTLHVLAQSLKDLQVLLEDGDESLRLLMGKSK
ncbi:hypothetical protein BC567DRAFT_253425 [Phyllosticta citribraziliensis]